MTPYKLTLQQLGLFLILAIAAFVANAQADPYSIEVAVYDKSDREQQSAYQLALRRVLRNTSGDKTVLNRDLIRQQLTQAIDYVKGFSYRTPPPGTVISSNTPVTARVRDTGQATQLMLVSFDRTLVSDLVARSAPSASAEAGDAEPVATLNTSSALLWLLIQDDGRDILISDPAAVNVQRRAREIAGAAGISLLYPGGDAEDQFALSIADMLSMNTERLAAASERYGQDMVLLGVLTRNSALGWRGEWVRLLGNESQQSAFDTQSLDLALQEGLQVLGSVAAIDQTYRYGGSATSSTEGLVWVGSLTSTEDYARVMQFFQGQASVSTVYPKEITESSMLFSVIPRSALAEIDAAAAGVSWLLRSALPSGISEGSASARNADLTLEYSR
ncbi:MAG: DUF2066 domain-containing protein [Granulosicoccus sp.]